MQAFQIHFAAEELAHLHERLDGARWPAAVSPGWAMGTGAEELAALLKHWRYTYDWKQREQALKRYPQFLCEIDGVTIHFLQVRSRRKNAMPVLLTHGWPDSFLRYVKVIDLLAEYDVVIPSLPGFAFSGLPANGTISNAGIAHLWHKLMTQKLGYQTYVASGGDMGRGVTCYLAAYYPQEVKGIHLTDVGLVQPLLQAPDETLTPQEQDYKRRATQWLQQEGGYIHLQSTKPQTVAYALSDSPVGLAAWMLEKYHAWSDWPLLSADDVCDELTLYWLTRCAGTSVRMYYANAALPPLPPLTVPTALAVFARDVLPAPEAWIKQHYPVVLYTKIPRGGHFTALEQPEAFATHLKQFIAQLEK